MGSDFSYIISIVPSFSEKLINSIEKSRKNRFVDDSYSQKAMEKLQRENEEMKTKLAELSTATTSIQVN